MGNISRYNEYKEFQSIKRPLWSIQTMILCGCEYELCVKHKSSPFHKNPDDTAFIINNILCLEAQLNHHFDARYVIVPEA